MKRSVVYFIQVILLVYSLLIFVQYNQSRDWPATLGQIIAVEKVTKSVALDYSYDVGGERYYNTQYEVSVVPFMYFVESYNRLAMRQEVGRICKVYYSPSSPSNSSLTRDYSTLELILAAVVLSYFVGRLLVVLVVKIGIRESS